jgi:hypothetical protein
MVNGAIREQSIVCSVRIFGTSGIAPLTLHIQPAGSPMPIGPYGGDRAAGAEPPTRVPLKRRIIYTMRIAPRPRDHARDPRAPVRSCWHVTQARTNPRQKSGNGSRSLFVDPALYTVKVRINNNCLLQGMPTRHRYKSCVWSMLYALRMHYVSCSVLGRRGYVGAVWGVASHPSATHVVYFCACA